MSDLRFTGLGRGIRDFKGGVRAKTGKGGERTVGAGGLGTEAGVLSKNSWMVLLGPFIACFLYLRLVLTLCGPVGMGFVFLFLNHGCGGGYGDGHV